MTKPSGSIDLGSPEDQHRRWSFEYVSDADLVASVADHQEQIDTTTRQADGALEPWDEAWIRVCQMNLDICRIEQAKRSSRMKPEPEYD